MSGETEDINVDGLKAVKPNAQTKENTRTPEELIDTIRAKGREIAAALAVLRRAGASR